MSPQPPEDRVGPSTDARIRAWEAQLAPGGTAAERAHRLESLAAAATRAGAPAVRWWARRETAGDPETAEAAGYAFVRRLHRIALDLPAAVEAPPTVDDGPGVITTFDLRRDAGAWVDVNNRAFAWHPDQRDWTAEDLAAKVGEPWVRPDGLLVHLDDDVVDGFCFCRAHDDEEPPAGEIHLIAVDPDRHATGLGRRLLHAGFAWMVEAGYRRAFLWVEADNEPALAFYRRAGFTLEWSDAAYERDLVRRPARTATRYDLTPDDLATRYPELPPFRRRQVWDGLHRRLGRFEDLTDLPRALRERLEGDLPLALTPVTESVGEGGATVKYLWALPDGARIETVLMHHRDGRATVCVSTQAGCAMACSFCATGQEGFERHLSTGEIVEQVIHSARAAAPRRISNVVFMGMGEPLANFDATWGAVRRLHDDLGIGARHLTVSTVGVVPGIHRLTEADLPVTLAVSLHVANDADRDALVPINRRYPLDVLATALEAYLGERHRRISFEWAMIDGVNDRPSDIEELAEYARPLRAHVNLIPLNPTPGYPVQGTPLERVHRFRDRLEERGVNTTVRRNRGTDIAAACGQLRAEHADDPATRPVTIGRARRR